MPSVTQLIKEVSDKKGVPQYIVEKDYAISFLLSAMHQTPGFTENLVLKGGTALRKLYFPGYRFSEDLDYSTIRLGQIEDCDRLMNEAVRIMLSMLDERGPFEASVQPYVLRQPHPGEQKAYIVRIKYPTHQTPLCRLKVEITVDEPIINTPNRLPILHEFTDVFTGSIPVYALFEITAEKLRALLQSKAKLKAKGWGATRVVRDYYDLWNLLQRPGIIGSELTTLFNKKCVTRNVALHTPEDLVSDDLIKIAETEWDKQLLPFVPDVPSSKDVLEQTKGLILSIWQ